MRIPCRKTIDALVDSWFACLAKCGLPHISSGLLVPNENYEREISDVAATHFVANSDHINYSSMRDTLALLGNQPATILETGSSAWGTNSTVLWDKYVQANGGSVWTVDIRKKPSTDLRSQVSSLTRLVCDDSVKFLRRWAHSHADTNVRLVYLDSFDVCFGKPFPAAVHCLEEYLAVKSHLRDGCLLLIDDTPGSAEWLLPDIRSAASEFADRHGVFPGKGMLVDLLLSKDPRVTKIHHRYQALYRFDN